MLSDNISRAADGCLCFAGQSREAATAREQAAALAGLLEALQLPRQLERRSRQLEEAGQEELAGEYRQLPRGSVHWRR